MANIRRPLLLTAQLAYAQTSARERFWIPVQAIAADGGARPIRGGTPFRQPCPAYPSAQGQKASQQRSSEESFRSVLYSETHFSTAKLPLFHAHSRTKS